MVGTVEMEQHAGAIQMEIAGDLSAGRRPLEMPAADSGASCASCGAGIEHDAALCSSCGRVVVKDAVFGSDGAPDAFPFAFGPRFGRTRLVDVVLETRRDSTWH